MSEVVDGARLAAGDPGPVLVVYCALAAVLGAVALAARWWRP